MANIGQYNRRLTYTQKGAATPDGIGGFTYGSGTSITTWCKARKLSQSESLLYGLPIGSAAYNFTVRFEHGTNINQTTELTYQGRKFRVISIITSNEAKRETIITANERTN